MALEPAGILTESNPPGELQLRGPVGRRFIGYRTAAEIVSPKGLGRLEPGKTEGRCRISLVPEARRPGVLVLCASKVQDKRPESMLPEVGPSPGLGVERAAPTALRPPGGRWLREISIFFEKFLA